MEYLKAFAVGGFICLLAQILIDKTSITPARILVILVVSGVGLTAVGAYEPIVEFAGAGATVPLCGFGYLMAKGVVESIKNQGLLGIITGGLTAGAAGISAAVFCGYLAALCSKRSQDKN
ncbi:MAG: stage V sporulation protein AE [Clostridia bacterium]|nr:stage V sporulation protein AE [Clostridia bacterium]